MYHGELLYHTMPPISLMQTLSLKTSILTQLAWGGAGPILKMLCGRGMCVTKLYLDLPTQREGQQGSLDGGLDTT